MAQTLVTTSRPAKQTYQILYIGFIVAPFLAGLDKFTHVLTNWDQYLAPAVERLLPFDRQRGTPRAITSPLGTDPAEERESL